MVSPIYSIVKELYDPEIRYLQQTKIDHDRDKKTCSNDIITSGKSLNDKQFN